MALLTATLGITLFITTVLLPWGKAAQQRQQLAFSKRVHDFKLYAVKHYHPAFQRIDALKNLSYEEIATRYNVSHLYDQIGR
ncbi:MAG: hypothetical protein K1X79_06060 [Oligoflexia bacterium]|nr:hypothetical protein [Oligoflexia bacterium]